MLVLKLHLNTDNIVGTNSSRFCPSSRNALDIRIPLVSCHFLFHISSSRPLCSVEDQDPTRSVVSIVPNTEKQSLSFG